MKEIPLTKGKVALVDDNDFLLLSQHRWRARYSENLWYAESDIVIDGRKVRVTMHREILGLVRGDRILSDHRDGNGLNNQRYNLRPCTNTQNQMNRRIHTKKASVYKGVVLEPKRKRPWTCQITIAKRQRKIGHFLTEEAAALAYNEIARIHFGEFACLNVVAEP